MPSKTSKKKPAAALPSIPKELIDQMVSGPMDAEAVNAASMAFKKALIERILGAELSHHLGYLPGAEKPGEIGNPRNGATSKTVLTEDGPLRIDIPLDRQGSFEPLLIPKHERRFTGFDDKIVAMYARWHQRSLSCGGWPLLMAVSVSCPGGFPHPLDISIRGFTE